MGKEQNPGKNSRSLHELKSKKVNGLPNSPNNPSIYIQKPQVEVRAATETMNATKETSSLQQFKILSKQRLITNINLEISKNTTLLSQLQFKYLKSNQSIQSRLKVNYSLVYQRQYKNKKEIADKLINLMQVEENRVKSEPMNSQTIEDLQTQIQKLMKESINQIQRQYHEKEENYQKQLLEELSKKQIKLISKMSQFQNKLIQSEFNDKDENIVTRYRNKIKQYIKEVLLKEKTERINSIKSEQAIEQKKYQKGYRQSLKKNQTLKHKHLQQIQKIRSKRQSLQSLHKEEQQNYQTSKIKIQTQLLKQSGRFAEKTQSFLQYLMIFDKSKDILVNKMEIDYQNKIKSLNQQQKYIKTRIIKDNDYLKNSKLKVQQQKIKEYQKIVSNIKSKIEKEKLLSRKQQLIQQIKDWQVSSIQLVQQSKSKQLEEKINQIKQEISFIDQQFDQIQKQESKIETIKWQCQKIEQQFQHEKSEAIKKSQRQIQSKIKQAKQALQIFFQEQNRKKFEINEQMKNNEKQYLQFQAQKQQQLQLIKNQQIQSEKRYLADKFKFNQQIQKYEQKIKQEQQQCHFTYKNKKQKLQETIKANVYNAQAQFSSNSKRFQGIYSQLFVKFQAIDKIKQSNYQSKKLKFINQLSDYAFQLKEYQQFQKQTEKKKDNFQSEKHKFEQEKKKQIQSVKIKFTSLLSSLNQCENNSENVWFTEQIYENTKKDLQYYNNFLQRKKEQIQSLKNQNSTFQHQMQACNLKLKQLNIKRQELLKEVVKMEVQLKTLIVQKEIKMEEQREKAGQEFYDDQQ